MSPKSDSQHARLRLTVRGAVQGVGFRPFVYRLATELQLTGWVLNSSQGVFIEVEGLPKPLEEFRRRLERERPPPAFIQSLESAWLDPVGYTAFAIRQSEESGHKTALILPDIATCPECVREIFDPHDRRYRYPFTNCTNCGPRFSIIEALPYDRPNTTMKKFPMCSDCQAEYDDPSNRRFHAQPNACPTCGPHLELWDRSDAKLASHRDALLKTAEAIRQGQIVAVKGLGGFHLIADARNEEAVQRLRERKRREEKPFALIYPDLHTVKAHCEVSELEERLLTSPESPIVLVRRKYLSPGPFPKGKGNSIAHNVAPRNPYLGVMLPYTPLHHLLMAELGFPIVATSGNLSDEPICTDEREALERLGKIADLFLVHNRPIARHVDDSIARIVAGRELVLRRARGYAPLPIHLKAGAYGHTPLLAVGAHLKNTVALSIGANVFISQHIGDLETAQAFDAFQRVIADFEHLYGVQPQAVAHDLHPEYLSTKHAQQSDLPRVGVQHHYAHVLSCMAENELEGPVLGVSWDGTGYGLDGTIWGGEFLWATRASFERVAHLRQFRLPGGERAIKEPRRTAIGLLYEIYGDELFAMKELAPVRAFPHSDLAVLRTMLQRRLNAPLTSSAGRLFDAVASLVGLRQETRFEGQAAMELEFALVETDEAYRLDVLTPDPSIASPVPSPFTERVRVRSEGWPQAGVRAVLDWEPMVHAILDDVRSGVSVSKIAAKFHNALVEVIVAIARRVGEEQVVLTGGCFQNKYLAERAVQRLRAKGFRVYWHQRVPPNDGGIALGQIIAASNLKE